MIAQIIEWTRNKVQGKPYDPTLDPVWRSLHDAKEEGHRRGEEAHIERRSNQMESVYLRRKLQPMNGNGIHD
jgi:hypothetical protein